MGADTCQLRTWNRRRSNTSERCLRHSSRKAERSCFGHEAFLYYSRSRRFEVISRGQDLRNKPTKWFTISTGCAVPLYIIGMCADVAGFKDAGKCGQYEESGCKQTGIQVHHERSGEIHTSRLTCICRYLHTRGKADHRAHCPLAVAGYWLKNCAMVPRNCNSSQSESSY